MNSIPVCPKCGRTAKEHITQFGRRNSCCDLWSWERAPLVDRVTHEARKKAHRVFDLLWRRTRHRVMGRGAAYAALARELGIPKSQCHIKSMDKLTAAAVPRAVELIRKRIKEDE